MTDRTKKQQECVRKWSSVGGKGTLQAATAFGKTRVALIIILTLIAKYLDFHLLVVVPSLYLKNQWEEKLNNLSIDTSKWEVIVINSLVKKHTESDPFKTKLLILDEIHRYTAAQFGKVFQVVTYEWVLGLTATLDKEKKKYVERYAPVFETIELEECVENGWVSDFIVLKMGVELRAQTLIEYKRLEQVFGAMFSKFEFDFGLAMDCLKDKNRRENYASRRGLDAGLLFGQAKKWFSTMQAKNNILYNATEKLELTRDIIKVFPDELTIAFGQTIDAAEELKHLCNNGKEICEVYHSRMSGQIIDGKKLGQKKLKENIIERFSDPDNELRALSTATSLDEGADIPDISIGIIYSRTSKKRQNIQRIGRAIRYVEDKQTKIFQVYVRDSQDEKWLNESLDKIPSSKIIEIDSLTELL